MIERERKSDRVIEREREKEVERGRVKGSEEVQIFFLLIIFLQNFKICVRRRGLIWNTFNAIPNDSSLVDRMPEKTGDYLLIVI